MIEPPRSEPWARNWLPVPVTAVRGPDIVAAGTGCCAAVGGATMNHSSPGPQVAAAQLVRLISVSYST